MSTPRLSILIPSLYKRIEFLHTLLFCIGNQSFLKETEVLINMDAGIKSIGEKRNELMLQAKGEYVVYIDDDDLVSADYLEKIFEGINQGVDHIGITMEFSIDQMPEELIKCSKDYKYQKKDGIIYRPSQHICPIRREIALQVKFPDKRFGEDKEWAELINPLLRSEYLVEEVIYYYNYRSNKNGI